MNKSIVLDPGHGGNDPGCLNNEFNEKDMVLKISLEQKRHFERNGIKVYMTRTSDVSLGSTERTNKVKSFNADYCISNHINAAASAQANGAETIRSIHSNKNISEGILDALVEAGTGRRRAFSKEGNPGLDYYFMHRQTGKANTVIVEYGFITNTGDSKRIQSDWKKYAEAVARYYIEKVFKQTYVPEHKEVATVSAIDEKKFFSTDSQALYDSVVDVLKRLEREDKPLSDTHRKKLEKGGLLESDAIGLLYVAVTRGYMR